jgi:4-amino-4-deoxy-L-arabinose transferase-like glycosyltransferase
LSGLLAFGVFGLWLLQNQPLKYWKHLLAAVTFSFAFIAPWHLYTYLNYPQVYLREMSYNSLHFWETLESHQHPWHYHLEMWWQNFWPFMLLFALIVGLILRSKPTELPKPKLIALAVGVLFVHLFFGLAQTKLSAYSLIGLIPFLMLLMLLLKPVEHLPLGRWGLRLTALLCTIGNLSWFIDVDLANKYPYHALRAQYYRELKQSLPEKVVIFNAERFRFPEAMFYSHRLVYDFLPSEQNLQECAAHGYSPVVIVRDSSQFDFERYQALKQIPHYH